jgi:hypothetical protein
MQKLTTLSPQNYGSRLEAFYTTIDPAVELLTLQVNRRNTFGADVSESVHF